MRAGSLPRVEGGLEPGHELVLVDDAVARVRRVGEAAALGGAGLEEAGVQEVRGLVDVAVGGLVGGDVAGHGHGDDHRGARGQCSRHVGPHGLARDVAPAEVVVVLVAVVGAGVRGVRLPVVGRPAVAAQPPEPQAPGTAGPVRLVHPVDVGRDRVSRGRRVDREPDAPGRPRASASGRRTGSWGRRSRRPRRPATAAPGRTEGGRESMDSGSSTPTLAARRAARAGRVGRPAWPHHSQRTVWGMPRLLQLRHDVRGRDRLLHPVRAGRHAPSGLHRHQDRGVPAGEALHRREAGGFVVPIHEIHGHPRRPAVSLAHADRAHDAHVADERRRDLRLEQAVVEVPGHHGPARPRRPPPPRRGRDACRPRRSRSGPGSAGPCSRSARGGRGACGGWWTCCPRSRRPRACRAAGTRPSRAP